MLKPGFALVSVVLAELNDAVSEAAANTLREPLSGELVVGVEVVADDFEDELDEQDDTTVASATSMGRKRRDRRRLTFPLSFSALELQ
jgi:hypothetical protein